MNKLMRIYSKCEKFPGGNWIFSQIVCRMAPYFGSIRPRFVELRPGYSKVTLKKRRAVQNHIGTVHAIAICNLAEVAAGIMIEASMPSHMRWIPKGMTVSYLRKAPSDLTATCSIDTTMLGTGGDFPMPVEVFDKDNNMVVKAVITMYLSEKKK